MVGALAFVVQLGLALTAVLVALVAILVPIALALVAWCFQFALWLLAVVWWCLCSLTRLLVVDVKALWRR